jgi:hypothetical protein
LIGVSPDEPEAVFLADYPSYAGIPGPVDLEVNFAVINNATAPGKYTLQLGYNLGLYSTKTSLPGRIVVLKHDRLGLIAESARRCAGV